MKLPALLISVWLAVTAYAGAADHVVTLTSLEWPPYTGELLPSQGASSAVATAAFAAMGYKLNITFLPWSRAVEEARRGKGVAGYFPEYYSSDVAANFTLSQPMGRGPLALAQRKDHRIEWRNIEDLSQWTVGTVQDYVNTPAFDERAAKHQQPIDVAPDDSLNLLKLDAGRVDLAIVDPYVFNWLAENDAKVRTIATKLEINTHQIEVKDLYVCFRRDKEGKRLAEIFNEGLKRIDTAAIMRRFIADYR
jgi:polar amino acid transport system substrate-binding protein